ncbi:hypothetical protein I7X12_10730 [Halosimplex litoreum]|uniref:histidine kinase n=1 Tax=Halosimplex litoreum TaxID=1198301 RepID=A0A7T3KTY9_9EURY|nr:histidine kinase N-terminal 7TM domain-containing protein [Halosimplex litoreum]QPV61245.1 hypothetical protein I7X12_10730 [Halosimplex litoreum]
MTWQLTPYAVPTLFAMGTAVVLGAYAARVGRDRGSDPTVSLFVCIAAATALWTGLSALKLFHTDPATKLLLYRALHVGIAALPPLFLLFVLAYTDRTGWLRPRVVAAVFALPLAFVALLVASPERLVVDGVDVARDGIVTVRVDDGPAFVLFSAYSMLLVACSVAVVGYEAVRVGPSYYPQAGWIAVGVAAPVVAGLLTAWEVPPFTGGVNLVPVSGAVSTAAFGAAVFRYRLFDLPPLAYTTAMKYSPDGMVVLDRDRRVVHANANGRAVVDATADSDAITGIVDGSDPESADGDLVKVAGDDGPKYYRPVVESLARGGRHVGWVVVLRDVTEQHRREQQLRRQTEQLDAFASTVSHDLRSPLTVAQGYLEFAQEDTDTDDDDAFEKVETAHDRMADIIDDVLTLSKQGKRIDDPEPVSLAAVAERAWESVETEAATLTVDADLTVRADAAMLRRVFENLYRNAVEHGESSVHVRVGTTEDGLFVEDDGPGIPPDERESVLEAGVTTNRHGTGYGLQIVDSIVAAHGWTLTVTESATGGARFEITGVT